jgi:hypothetical protein
MSQSIHIYSHVPSLMEATMLQFYQMVIPAESPILTQVVRTSSSWYLGKLPKFLPRQVHVQVICTWNHGHCQVTEGLYLLVGSIKVVKDQPGLALHCPHLFGWKVNATGAIRQWKRYGKVCIKWQMNQCFQ